LFMAIQQLRHRIFSPPLLEAKHREDCIIHVHELFN
jgi:hypothetical protein